MNEVVLPDTHCLFWKCFARIDQDGMCNEHYLQLDHRVSSDGETCRRCGGPPPENRAMVKLMCTGCYSWWRRNKGPNAAKIIAQDKARNRANRMRERA